MTEPQAILMDNGSSDEDEPMHCVIMLNSYRTSNATITLRDFRMNGIPDGHKYVPKAADVVAPYFIEHYIPEMHMNLAIITDIKLFSQNCNHIKQAIETESSKSVEEAVTFEDPLDVLYGVE